MVASDWLITLISMIEMLNEYLCQKAFFFNS